MACKAHESKRDVLFNDMDLICQNFSSLNNDQKFIYLMTVSHKGGEIVGKFLHEVFKEIERNED
jgi:hypothetical protein